MKPAATARLLFWPALTALLVILVAQFADRRDFSSSRHEPHATKSRSAAVRALGIGALPAPWTLSCESDFPAGNPGEPLSLLEPRPLNRTTADRANHRPGKARAAERRIATPRVRLQAPIISERYELAGIEGEFASVHNDYLAPLLRTASVRQSSQADSSAGNAVDAVLPHARLGTSAALTTIEHQASPIAARENWPPTSAMRVAELPRAEPHSPAAAWPDTPALERLLDRLTAPAAAAWADSVRGRLKTLRSQSALTTATSGALLQDLDRLVADGLADAERNPRRDVQRDWLAAAQALQRRVAVWRSIWYAIAPSRTTPVSHQSVRIAEIAESIDEVRALAQTTGDAEDWLRFLLVDQIETLFAESERDDSRAARQLLAHRVLSRLQWHLLTEEQQQWVSQQPVRRLATALKPWATRPVDYTALLQHIEWQESEPINSTDHKLAGVVQSLRHADDRSQQVAANLNDYYRNANLRIAISKSMLARLVPQPERKVQLVRNRILGADVRGTSTTAVDFEIDLIPAMGEWHVRMHGKGHVDSFTNSEKGPVRLHHHGRARFAAATDIVVDRFGARVSQPTVEVAADESLRNIASDFDGLPLLGSLVRTIALDQYRRDRREANSITTQLIERKVAAQMATELDQKLDTAEQSVTRRLLGPLAQLSLQPLVVDIETTKQRLEARYRFASPWQLAASSPRPRAPVDSVLSVQLHQSAINNLLQQLAPTDQMTSFPEIARRIADLFQLPADSAAKVPQDMNVQFASRNPAVVVFAEDRAQLVLKIVRLARDNESGLKYFIVKAEYHPVIEDGILKLRREGVLEISGPRLGMGDRIAIRAVFNALLNDDRELPLMDPSWLDDPRLADVELTQVELRDGWLGVAFGLSEANTVSELAANQNFAAPSPH